MIEDEIYSVEIIILWQFTAETQTRISCLLESRNSLIGKKGSVEAQGKNKIGPYPIWAQPEDTLIFTWCPIMWA